MVDPTGPRTIMKIRKIYPHIYLHAPIQIIHNKLWYMNETTSIYETTSLCIELNVSQCVLIFIYL